MCTWLRGRACVTMRVSGCGLGACVHLPQGHTSLAWILAARLPTNTDLDLTAPYPPSTQHPAGQGRP